MPAAPNQAIDQGHEHTQEKEEREEEQPDEVERREYQ